MFRLVYTVSALERKWVHFGRVLELCL